MLSDIIICFHCGSELHDIDEVLSPSALTGSQIFLFCNTCGQSSRVTESDGQYVIGRVEPE